MKKKKPDPIEIPIKIKRQRPVYVQLSTKFEIKNFPTAYYGGKLPHTNFSSLSFIGDEHLIFKCKTCHRTISGPYLERHAEEYMNLKSK